MQLNAVVDSSISAAGEVVRGISPDHLGAPTPCAEWDVRALREHVLQVVSALHLAGRGEPVPDALWGGATGADFDAEGRAAAKYWAEPEAWQRTIVMGASAMPATMAATMFAGDLVIHGWDLARATGQAFACDDAAAESVCRFLEASGEQGRAMGIFAPAVPVPDTASALDRALALSGRDPAWSPPA